MATKHLDHLDHARRKFVALLELGDLLVVDVAKNVDLALGALFVFFDLSDEALLRTCRQFSLTQQFGMRYLETMSTVKVCPSLRSKLRCRQQDPLSSLRPSKSSKIRSIALLTAGSGFRLRDFGAEVRLLP
jgi:hypothetical protein